MEVIFETVFVLIFRYPGAFIRWLFLFKKRSFKSILKDDSYLNAAISFIVIGAIIAIWQFVL